MQINTSYPPAPANVPPGLTEASDAFRSQVRGVVIAIIAFVFTYFLMVSLSLGLLWYCFKIGMVIIMTLRGIWGLILGLGLMMMGLMVVFFLLKFLFASADEGGSNGVEIQESDDPQLFAFIGKVAEEVGTHFPKKVFLIPDVNASVFYSSSFWSLFFPTRKNLNIGLGLVNSLNSSEFKAVLAHEFGHFSQKSMRLGSYVYYVNQVIFNMLYRNNGWVATADAIASVHVFFGLMVQGAVFIVQFIQWVLRGMYSIINRQYLRLSREMEFHADAIAASVAGGNNAAQALRQVEVGSINYQRTIDKCNELLSTQTAPLNFYAGQRAAAAHFATVNNLPLRQGLPVIDQQFRENQQPTRVVFTNQWASHPTTDEREGKLLGLGIDVPVVETPAWAIFQNPERWQKELTNYIYKDVDAQVGNIDDQTFANSLTQEDSQRQFPKIYNHYYDGHMMADPDLVALEENTAPKVLTTSEIKVFFEENLDLKIDAIVNDVQIISAIAEGNIDTKTFDFDGQKFEKERAHEVMSQLAKEKTAAEKERDQRDQEITHAFYAHALAEHPGRLSELLAKHRAVSEAKAWKIACGEPCHAIFVTVHFLGQNNFEVSGELVQLFQDLNYTHVPALRKFFKTMDLQVFSPELQEKIKVNFLGDLIEYQYQRVPHQTNLDNLRNLTIEIGEALAELYFNRMKALLEMQEALVKG